MSKPRHLRVRYVDAIEEMLHALSIDRLDCWRLSFEPQRSVCYGCGGNESCGGCDGCLEAQGSYYEWKGQEDARAERRALTKASPDIVVVRARTTAHELSLDVGAAHA